MLHSNSFVPYVTCSDKRDHSGFFVNILFLIWIVSAMYVEYNGESSMKKYCSWPKL